MKLVYLAHPLSGDIPGNLAEAKRWARWIYDHFDDVAVVAPWILDAEILDDTNPAHRASGLAHGRAVVVRCDEMWCFGPRVSGGMAAEIAAATTAQKRVLDFTGLPRDDATAVKIKNWTWFLCNECSEPANHMETFYGHPRGWCENHTPWSGHYEYCPDPCKKLLAKTCQFR